MDENIRKILGSSGYEIVITATPLGGRGSDTLSVRFDRALSRKVKGNQILVTYTGKVTVETDELSRDISNNPPSVEDTPGKCNVSFKNKPTEKTGEKILTLTFSNHRMYTVQEFDLA